MKITRHNVCTVVELSAFGGKIPSGYDSWEGYTANPYEFDDFDDFKAILRKRVEAYNSVAYEDYETIEQKSMIVAYTASTQQKANGYLKKLGFTLHREASCGRYEHTVLLWSMDIPSFLSAIGYKPS